MTKSIGIHFNITVVGAGNVAWHLAKALYDAGHHIVEVCSRNISTAQSLARMVGATATDDFNCIKPTSHIYIYAIKDDALEWVINNVKIDYGLHIHTSGSVPMSVFASSKTRYGCMYPLQTFTKGKGLDMSKVPFFIESNTTEDEAVIGDLAQSISRKVYRLPSQDREYIHLAGVFASNFTNLMYYKAASILEERGIPLSVLNGLMTEAVNKAKLIGPEQAQTGPAIRGDKKIMDKHISMLADDPLWKEVYLLLSELIQGMKHK